MKLEVVFNLYNESQRISKKKLRFRMKYMTQYNSNIDNTVRKRGWFKRKWWIELSPIFKIKWQMIIELIDKNAINWIQCRIKDWLKDISRCKVCDKYYEQYNK